MSSPFELTQLIVNLRPDLCQLFGFDKANKKEALIAWLITAGINEYRSIPEDKALAQQLRKAGFGPDKSLTYLQYLVLQARPDVAAVYPVATMKHRFLDWFYTHGVEECAYWPFLSEDEKEYVFSLPEPWGARLKSCILEKSPLQQSRIPFSKRPFGVNLIGYAHGQLGIGEDVRMAARSLLAADVPFTMVNFPPGADVPQNDLSMAQHVTESGQYTINCFCITAEETGRFFAERGKSQFEDRYNIGYWPWELSKWPTQWEMLLDLVDEIWVSTKHTYDALAPLCSKPLFLMPMAVELGQIRSFASRQQARSNFKLPENAKLFCFAFDLKSSVDRKNPQACVEAFISAFPKPDFAADAVGLVIKAHKPAQRNRLWEKLKRLAAEDDRIHIIEETMPRPDLLALYQACDCFISLHRAEGFGRGLAEALQLGLHVITTGYSGNVDFCQPPHADLVRYRLVNIRKNQYPHAEGQVWAEPDVEHAASLMRNFVLKHDTAKIKTNWPEWPEFSVQAVGAAYKARLQNIHKQLSA